MLQFKSHKMAEVVVAEFVVPGLCEGPELEETSQRLTGLVGPGRCKHVVLDFARVQFIASSALAVLVGLKQATDLYGGTMIVCGLRRQLQQVLKLSGLDRHLTLHGTRDEALAALGVEADSKAT